MSIHDKFGTAINCIDGRVQMPVAEWVKLHGHVQYVDMITEPGVDKVIAEGRTDDLSTIYQKVMISINAHQSSIVVLAGHFDCAANPATFDQQKEQIEKGVEILESWKLGTRIVGLYVNEWNAIDQIYDSNDGFEEIKSYL